MMIQVLIIQMLLALPQDSNMEQLLDAICIVESGGDCNAIGDSGRAIGPYQIHKAYWQDGCRFLGVNWNYEEARNPNKARQVVRAYLNCYGRGLSIRDRCRIHNGGPAGHKKKSTEKYWLKVKKVMEKK